MRLCPTHISSNINSSFNLCFTMCVLWTLTFLMFHSDIYSFEHAYWRLDTWLNRMHPEYGESRQYEGTSRYIIKHDFILTSLKLKKQRQWCKYETRSKIAALVECYFIMLGREYDVDDILEFVDMIDKHQCFYYYFHCK